METLNKNLLKQPFFWTSICSLLAVGIMIGLYSYAWVAPTASPNSNAGAAINFSGGKVGIGLGTTLPDAALTIKTPGSNAALNMYGIVASTDYSVIQVSTSGGLTNPSARALSLQPNAGSVGIGLGTALPSEKLEVAGNIKLSGVTPTYKLTNLLTPTADTDAATKAYVDAAGGGVTSFIIDQAKLIGTKTGKMLDPSNVCKASIASASSTNYTLADIDGTSTWNGVLLINSTSLTDSDSNGIKETSLLTYGKLGFDQDGALIEGVPADPRTQIRCMFITTTTFNGNLGGKTGAAAKCQTEATNAGITGTYQALLSGYLPSPLSASYPLVTASGVTVRSTASGITTFGTALLASPNKSAANATITPGSAWGMPGAYNCTNWAATTGNGCYLRMGSWSSAATSDCSNTVGTNGWGGYYTSNQACTGTLPLVCVEIN